MFGLVLGALRRRWAQSMLLFVLAAVATTGAAATPVYAVGSVQSLAAAAIDSAGNSERLVAASARRGLSTDAAISLRSFADEVTRELDLRDFGTVMGTTVTVLFGRESGRLDYREDLCAHLALRGACPAAAREVVIDETFAAQLGVAVGDELAAAVDGSAAPDGLKVVGLYQPVDRSDLYWGRPPTEDAATGERLGPAYAFTVLPTYAALGRSEVTMSVDFAATAQAFRERDPQLHAQSFERGAARLRANDVIVASELRVLANRIFDNQRLIYVGVAIGAAELLLICWFALFLAVTQTGHDRRADVGLLRMRGARRRDIWRLLAGQSLIPLAAGGVVGYLAGPWLVEWAGAPIAGADVRRTVGFVVAGFAVVAVGGAAVAALIAERRVLRQSVTSLSRGIAGSPWTWGAGTFDAVVVAVAIAAAYQARAGDPASGSAGWLGGRGVELLAPLLLTLAVGVVAARLIPVAAARIGRQAVRSGRLSTALAAMHLARRPATARVLGLVTVVAAVVCGTALSWYSSDQARHERAVYEVGDERVLTVHTSSPARLLDAVRTADPEGRHAMAAVEQGFATPVLAVDASRLGAVVPMLPAYGIADWQSVASALRPATMESMSVGSAALTLDATRSSPGTGRPGPLNIIATLQGPDAMPVTVSFGPLTSGRHSYPAPATVGCDPACRLVSLTLSSGRGAPPDPGTVVTLHSLSGLDGAFTDRGRWRAGVVLGDQVARITAGADGLSLTVTDDTRAGRSGVDAAVFVLDAPTPMPVVFTRGNEFSDAAEPRVALMDPTGQPVQVVAQASGLPRIGRGVLVDLEYADRLAQFHDGGRMQVWLAPGAPEVIVQRLTDAGLTIVADESVGDRMAVLSAQGPPVALRFLLLVAVAGVALAVVSFAVMAAVERRARGIELAALRRQGLGHRVVRRVAFGGYAALVGAAVVAGAVTAALLAAFVPSSLPVFDDGWDPLVVRAAPDYVLLAVAAAVAFILGVLAAGSALGLAAAVRRRVAEAP